MYVDLRHLFSFFYYRNSIILRLQSIGFRGMINSLSSDFTLVSLFTFSGRFFKLDFFLLFLSSSILNERIRINMKYHNSMKLSKLAPRNNPMVLPIDTARDKTVRISRTSFNFYFIKHRLKNTVYYQLNPIWCVLPS